MADHAAWAVAYARQARADFETYDQLRDWPIPECHKRQFLQMACEKLVKSHLRANKGNLADLQKSHAFVAKSLPVVLRRQAVLVGLGEGAIRNANHFAKCLSAEIEWLSPSMTREGRRPDNCEYPWESGDSQLQVPIDWSFTATRLPLGPSARTFLNLTLGAINRLVV